MAKDNQVYDEAFGLLADEIGVLDSKVMGVFGAMRRGLSKEEALKSMTSPKRITMKISIES